MSLVPFAKPGDLQVLAPAVSDAQATLVLDLVSGTIRESLGWDVDEHTTTYTQDVPPGSRRTAAVLPVLNLTEVTSVEVDGTAQAAGAYYFTASGIVYLTSAVATRSVAVTCTAGYSRVPTDKAPSVLRSVALDYAMRMVANPTGVASYAIGGTSETFASDLTELAASDHRLDNLRVKA